MKYQAQPSSQVNLPVGTPLSIDPTVLLEHGNSPTSIILAISILLWVLRPIMMLRSGKSK